MGLRSAGRRVAEQEGLIGWLALLVFGCITVLFPLRTDFLNRDSLVLFMAPDAQPKLTVATLREALSSLSLGGRALYAWSEVTLDGVFPLLYGLLLILGMQRLWPRPASRGWNRLRTLMTVTVPLVVVACDWLENLSFFRLARHADWPPIAADLSALLALERLGLFAHALKFGALALCLVIVVVVLIRSGAAGQWLPYFWYGRVPGFGALVLLGLSFFGGSGERSPTLPNMLLFESASALALVVFLAAYLAALVGFQWVLIAELAPLRFGTLPVDLPAVVRRGDPGSTRRGLPFFVLALPLALRGAFRSVFAGKLSLIAALLAVAAGFVACWLVFLAVEKARGGPMRAAARLLRLAGRWHVLRRLGPGYWDPQTRDLYPGHGLAATAFVAGLAVYAGGYLSLDPGSGIGVLRDLVPTLAYLVAMTSFLAAILAGVSFFADRWRIPLIAILVLWPMVWAQLPGDPVAHRFTGEWQGCAGAPRSCLPLPAEALRARLEKSRPTDPTSPRVATIVTASGGGIQAAAWAARVLAGVEREVGPDFTRSIVLMSAVSGGSVGTYFALEALDSGGGLGEERRTAMVRAAQSSSLESAAWGLLYPDLLRGVFPPFSPRRDRGWAMERAWLAHRERAAGFDSTRGTWRTWVDGAREGRLPAVLFNATRVDDGGPFAITSVDLSGSIVKSFEHLPEEPGYLDLARVTAARISATFPYVTPIAAPAASDVRQWHLADGGYFDNHGVVGALAWIEAVRRAEGNPLRGIDTLLWLQIDGFAEELAPEPLTNPGWFFSAIGPLQAMLKVRSNSQRIRRDEEISLLARALGEETRLVVADLRPLTRGRTDPPVSWYLSAEDQARLCRDWNGLERAQALEAVRRVFGVAAATGSGGADENCAPPR